MFTSLALIWTFPLVLHLSDAIPGSGAGDNVAALWNFWWARFARLHDLDFLQTEYLFAPHGTSLALHSHVIAPAWIGAYILGRWPLIPAHNLLLLTTVALNGLTTYWLAFDTVKRRGAAVLAGVLFAGSPFVGAHLQGHFNVISAWTIPLAALLARKVSEPARPGKAVALGATLGLTALLDYYYAIYATVLATVIMLSEQSAWRFTWDRTGASRTAWERRWFWGMVVGFIASSFIVLSGGFDLRLGSVTVRAHDAFNVQQATSVLAWLWVWCRWHPVLDMRSWRSVVPDRRQLVLIGLAALVVASPVLIALGRLVRAGDYLAPWPLWRSGTAGVDIASAFVGNPFSSLSGAWTRAFYTRHGIDAIEQSAWLGVVAPSLAAMATLRSQSGARRLWLLVGVLAGGWALGPHLRVLGWNTGVIMPNALLRYLPLVSNARIPGRALVIVTLALAMLAAMGWVRLRESNVSRWWLLPLLVLIGLELGPMPFPLTTLDHPALYDVARIDPQPGSLLELPMGMRDGFGEEGNLDHRVLWYQTIHERPLVGGFVARLSPAVRAAFTSHQVIQDLLALSRPMPGPAPSPAALPDGRAALSRLGVAFVVVDAERASPELVAYIADLPLKEEATSGRRTLYRVVPESAR